MMCAFAHVIFTNDRDFTTRNVVRAFSHNLDDQIIMPFSYSEAWEKSSDLLVLSGDQTRKHYE
jgi:hypothetical protein